MKTPERQVVTVRERVDVTLNRAEVEHCLRCWLEHKLAPNQAPHAKTLGDIFVSFELDLDQHGETRFGGVTLTYEPSPRKET